MKGKKLTALLIAPMFALGMAACDTEPAQDDIWTDEGQIPAQQDPYMTDTLHDPYDVHQDTLMQPQVHPETPEARPDEGMTRDPHTDTDY